MSVSQHQVSGQFHLSHPEHNADSRTLPVLIFFEHLITADREIDLFWKHKFSVPAALFLTNRYLILVYSALGLVGSFDTSVSAEVSQTDSHAADSTWADTFAPPRCELCFSQLLVATGHDSKRCRCNVIQWGYAIAELGAYISPAGRRHVHPLSARHSTENQPSSVLCHASIRSDQF